MEGSVRGGGRLPTHTAVAGVVDVRKTTTRTGSGVPGRFVPGWDGRATTAED